MAAIGNGCKRANTGNPFIVVVQAADKAIGHVKGLCQVFHALPQKLFAVRSVKFESNFLEYRA